MIISHKHKFIFLKTRKTAGTSIEFGLRSICGPRDVITRTNRRGENKAMRFGVPPAQNNKIPFKEYDFLDWFSLVMRRERKNIHQHVGASYIKRKVTDEVWNTYFKFCFDRNPFDKVISYFYWLKKNGKGFDSITQFLLSDKIKNMNSYDLYSINNNVVDKIYKYEYLDESICELSDTIGLTEKLKLPIIKPKANSRLDKRHYREVLTKEDRDIIESLYAREIALLSYTY